MAKNLSRFVCQQCGAVVPKWQGQCSSCGSWNTFVEELAPVATASSRSKAKASPAIATLLSDVELASDTKRRFSTTIGELDRVLGGGIVPGAVILVGGEPGIGKSTLLTELVLRWSQQHDHIYYVCGEESPQQISLRINRMIGSEYKNFDTKKTQDRVSFVSSTDVDQICSLVETNKPSLLIVDSIQTLVTQDLTGAEGSVGQVREAAQRLTETAKRTNTPLFIVGHVTKEGTIAGPKVLEHIVDTVLEIHGERTGQFRLVRAIKNRFGATNEVGVFQLTDTGIVEVPNPSALFLENADQVVVGSATVGILEGTRPLFVEVQALVVPSHLPMPRRVGRGIDLNRIQVLAAVLQKHAHVPLDTHDIFVSVVGGFSVKEPAVDLGVALAMVSSLRNEPLPAQTVCIGELGLLGEVRTVQQLDQRTKEALRLGYTKIISRKTHRRISQVMSAVFTQKKFSPKTEKNQNLDAQDELL